MYASCIVSASRWLGIGWAGGLLRLLAAVTGGAVCNERLGLSHGSAHKGLAVWVPGTAVEQAGIALLLGLQAHVDVSVLQAAGCGVGNC
jgi:hypothetical protein